MICESSSPYQVEIQLIAAVRYHKTTTTKIETTMMTLTNRNIVLDVHVDEPKLQ